MAYLLKKTKNKKVFIYKFMKVITSLNAKVELIVHTNQSDMFMSCKQTVWLTLRQGQCQREGYLL